MFLINWLDGWLNIPLQNPGLSEQCLHAMCYALFEAEQPFLPP